MHAVSWLVNQTLHFLLLRVDDNFFSVKNVQDEQLAYLRLHYARSPIRYIFFTSVMSIKLNMTTENL